MNALDGIDREPVRFNEDALIAAAREDLESNGGACLSVNMVMELGMAGYFAEEIETQLIQENS